MRRLLALVVIVSACGSDAVGALPPDAPPGPFELPVQCTTGTRWKLGDQRSPLMHPGVACNACHDALFDAPRFAVAGTVYATGHEPDNCNGAPQATIEIIGADDTTLTLVTNEAGNFYTSITTPIAFPIRARVVSGSAIREMVGAVASGDCNSCHTQDGAEAAPGRVALP